MLFLFYIHFIVGVGLIIEGSDPFREHVRYLHLAVVPDIASLTPVSFVLLAPSRFRNIATTTFVF